MAIPDPPAMPHKLIAGANRLVYRQLNRTENYLRAVLPVLASDNKKEGENLEFCLETIVVMLYAFLEEYYKLVISLATLHEPQKVRSYMATRIRSEAGTYEAMPAGELSMNVSQRFSFSSKKLENFKGLFNELFEIQPFPNQTTESMLHDLAVVRNIITHQGGTPGTNDIENINSPDVLVTSNELGISLQIANSFIIGVLKAGSRLRDIANLALLSEALGCALARRAAKVRRTMRKEIANRFRVVTTTL